MGSGALRFYSNRKGGGSKVNMASGRSSAIPRAAVGLVLFYVAVCVYAASFQNLDFEQAQPPANPDTLENSFQELFPAWRCYYPGWDGYQEGRSEQITTAWYNSVWDVPGVGLSDAAVPALPGWGVPVVLSGRFSAALVTRAHEATNWITLQQTGDVPSDARSLRFRTTAYPLLSNGVRSDQWGVNAIINGSVLPAKLLEITSSNAVWVVDVVAYAGRTVDLALCLWIDDRCKPTGSLVQYTGVALDGVEFSAEPASGLPAETACNVVAWGQRLDTMPVPPGASNLVMATAGYLHKVGLRSDGGVFAWGDAMKSCTFVPPAASNVISIAAGHSKTYALTESGGVLGWPAKNILYEGVTNAVAISASATFALVLLADGTVIPLGEMNRWFWSFDPLTQFPAYVPAGLSNVCAVAAGGLHGLALRRDGTVLPWTRSNRFPDGSEPPRGNSVQTNVPPSATNITAIAAGGFHSLALKDDGTVVAWGENDCGQTNVPAGLSNVVAISAGSYHSLALRNDGTVVAWGDNEHGQTNVPAALSNVVAISAGGNQSLALIGSSPRVNRVALLDWSLKDSDFTVSIPTEPGCVYSLEYTGDLRAPMWRPLPLVSGTGATLALRDKRTEEGGRFYRVKRW